MGVRIDVIYLSSPQSNAEIQINQVTLPDYIERGVEVNLRVTVKSAEVGNATVKVYDNNELIGNGLGYNVLLNGAEDILSFEHTFLNSGVHEIRVEIEKVYREYNVYYTLPWMASLTCFNY